VPGEKKVILSRPNSEREREREERAGLLKSAPVRFTVKITPTPWLIAFLVSKQMQ